MNPELLGIIRHVVTLVCGGLIAGGTLSMDDVNTIAGVVGTVLAVGWSIYEKRKGKTPEQAAK